MGERPRAPRGVCDACCGAGFGGLELPTRLSEKLGDEIEIVLIDQADAFVIGFSKLDVMFGRTDADAISHRYLDIVKPGVRFVQTTVRTIDPLARRVETDAGGFDADVVVVALGADLDPAATPGLVEGGNEFYTVAGAFAAREVLAGFGGGGVIVGVTSTPFKCPPAPSEAALMVHEFLVERGLGDHSEVALVMPFGAPVPPSPAASEALLAAFAERGIVWHPNRSASALDPDRKVAILDDGEEPVPWCAVHRAAAVVLESTLAHDGWIPVDSLTLEMEFPDVYAVGDVTSIGTPKAGVFAEGQAGLVEVAFLEGNRPVGAFAGPSQEHVATKAEFGSSRIRRWFGREWNTY
jgi:sulfide:quinone oxidoreductase